GFEAPAAAWEQTILPSRVDGYDPSWLDMLCLTGEVAWARTPAAAVADSDPSAIVASTPIALFPRAQTACWTSIAPESGDDRGPGDPTLQAVLRVLRERGALFGHELASAAGVDEASLQSALARLVGAGLITSDGFGGLRALLRSGGSRLAPRGRAHVAG